MGRLCAMLCLREEGRLMELGLSGVFARLLEREEEEEGGGGRSVTSSSSLAMPLSEARERRGLCLSRASSVTPASL